MRVRDHAFSGRFSRAAGQSMQAAQRRRRGVRRLGGGSSLRRAADGDDRGVGADRAAGVGDRELYDLRGDPGQEHNLLADRPEVAAALHAALVDFLQEAGALPERVRLYTEPQPRLTLRPDTPLYVLRDAAELRLAFPREAEAADALAHKCRTSRLPWCASGSCSSASRGRWSTCTSSTITRKISRNRDRREANVWRSKRVAQIFRRIWG